MFPLIVVAERQMNRRQSADWFHQLSKRRVIARLAGLEREVAIDDDCGGLYRPRVKLANAGGEIVRHVDAAVSQ